MASLLVALRASVGWLLVAGACGAFLLAARWALDPLFLVFAVMVGALGGTVLGLATGVVHGVVQAVLSATVWPGRPTPLTHTVVATLTSAAGALVTLAVLAADPFTERAELAAWLLALTAYAACTWPAARKAFTPRRRR